MPKHIPLRIVVEEIALGRFMLLLNKTPGVVKFDIDLTDKSAKSNGHAKPPKEKFDESTSPVLVRTILMKRNNKPMHRDELAAAFIKAKRSGRSVDSATYPMRKAGLLNMVTPGIMQLTDKGKSKDWIVPSKKRMG